MQSQPEGVKPGDTASQVPNKLAVAKTDSAAEVSAFEKARALVGSYLAIYDSYHSRKETTAYGVVTVYLGGAVALFLHEPFWIPYTNLQLLGLGVALVLTAALAFLFVYRQFQLMRSAGDMYSACSNLLCKWINSPEVDTESLAVHKARIEEKHDHLFKQLKLPEALFRELDAIRRPPTKPDCPPRPPTEPDARRYFWQLYFSFGAMVMWTLAVLLRIAHTHPSLRHLPLIRSIT